MVLFQREWKHSKLTDLGEKNVHERERERERERVKQIACTEALSEKQRDRWHSRGRLRGKGRR